MNTPPPACSNCGEALADLPRPPRFCPACGQETQLRAPTLMEFAQQFGGAYFSTEGALWRTLKLLVTRPGELTARYFAGQRKHYVLPLRLYLTISLLVLLALRVAGTGAVKVQLDAKTQAEMAADNRNFTLDLGRGKAGLREGVFFCQDLPGWACERLKRRIDVDPAQMGRELDGLKERFLSQIGSVMFLLLPGFALWLKLAYLNRRLRYTEHLVFALHVHAFWFIALAFTLPDRIWLSLPAFTAVPIYTMLALRRVYGGRRWPRFLRAGLVAVLYAMTMVLAFTGLGLWVLLA